MNPTYEFDNLMDELRRQNESIKNLINENLKKDQIEARGRPDDMRCYNNYTIKMVKNDIDSHIEKLNYYVRKMKEHENVLKSMMNSFHSKVETLDYAIKWRKKLIKKLQILSSSDRIWISRSGTVRKSLMWESS